MAHEQQQQAAFTLLQDYARRGREHGAELPSQDEVREEWGGIGFRLGGVRCVAALGDVTEILTYPDLSRVPRAKPWVKGLANVRGNLLPIMDLNAYLGRPPARLNRDSRVLVIDRVGVQAGLLVDEVLGMRHFFQEEYGTDVGSVDAAVAPYVTGVFRRGDGDWHVFDMHALAANPQFLKVAG